MYNRRNKMNPLWNSLVVGGVDPSSGSPFLGMVSMQGTHYVDSHVTTGGWVSRCVLCCGGVTSTSVREWAAEESAEEEQEEVWAEGCRDCII